MTAPALITHGLNKSFGSLVVANDIELVLPQGERYALIGPNGAGKTTLINLMTGMLKPDSGQILLGDDDITRVDPDQRVKRGLARTFQINSLFPHKLLALCASRGARLIHLSTDCVFSGKTGGYREADTPDPVDLYGHTKLLGELQDPPGLTLRTSIIGLELSRRTGLIEWFLAQRGRIRGFRRAVYTGFTTREMGRIVLRLVEQHDDLHGVWHVASAPINKYTLLVELARKLRRSDVEIAPDDTFACDRSLCADRFRAATGYAPPSWDAMLTELADEVRRRAMMSRA